MSRAEITLVFFAAVLSASNAHAQLENNGVTGVSYRKVELRAVSPAADSSSRTPGALIPSEFRALAQLPLSQGERGGQLFPNWMAPLFSAMVPGTGQLQLGENRFAAYMAIEAYGWIRFARHRADARRDRDGYRSLAAEVARSLFTENGPVGDFDYYERMEKFIESGVFDAGEEADIQPEPDETTFNGSVWRRARDTFWDDPSVAPPLSSRAYQQSIEYYSENAVTSEFRWSWRNAQLQHDQFRRTIAGSNDAFRRSLQDLGVILGNHVLSMVDALVSVRLTATGGSGARGYSVVATIPTRAPAP